MPRPRDEASFGRGVRWWCCTIGRVDWSIALAVPLAVLAIFLITITPALLDRDAGVDSSTDFSTDSSTSVARLASVWVLGLAIQAAMTQALFSITRFSNRQRVAPSPPVVASLDERPRHAVTLTMGGVWIAIPDVVFDDQQVDSADNQSDRRTSLLDRFSGASRVLVLWSMLLIVLGLGVTSCLLVDVMTTGGELKPAAGTEPAVAVASVARPWIAAAWMLCLQGFWQLMPLPQSLGRVGWSAAIGLFAASPDAAASERGQAQHAVQIVRRWLVAWSLATLVIGVLLIYTSGISTQPGGRALPAFAGLTLLALWLLMSTRGEDLFASQMTLASNGETGILKSRMGFRAVFQRWQLARRQREQTQRLIAAAQRERAEASDAARVDDILQRLHNDGPESLTNEERGILSRVSEAIRRERARDHHNPHSR